MSDLLRNLGSSGAVQYLRADGIWVMVLHSPPVEADMLLARPSLSQMKKTDPSGFPTLTWILPSAGFSLDAASKDAAAKITSEFSTSILARATLIEGSGFQAATVRAIVTGIDLFSRTKSPAKVFSELEESVLWCQNFLVDKSSSSSASKLTRVLLEHMDRLRAPLTVHSR